MGSCEPPHTGPQPSRFLRSRPQDPAAALSRMGQRRPALTRRPSPAANQRLTARSRQRMHLDRPRQSRDPRAQRRAPDIPGVDHQRRKRGELLTDRPGPRPSHEAAAPVHQHHRLELPLTPGRRKLVVERRDHVAAPSLAPIRPGRTRRRRQRERIDRVSALRLRQEDLRFADHGKPSVRGPNFHRRSTRLGFFRP